MITASDFLRLPYDHSLTLAGAEYARQSLHYTYNRMRLPPAARLRKIVAGKAVELAFRRWLEREGVPYDLRGTTHFTERDRSDIFLGGRHCDVKSFLLSDKPKIRALRADPGPLLGASALVPADQLASESMGERDVYVFGFLLGLETRRAAEVQKAFDAGQPLYLLHTLEDHAWARPDVWRSLGRPIVKSNAKGEVEIEIGGQDATHEVCRERLALSPGKRTEAQSEFHSILYLKADSRPDGEIGLRSPVLRQTQVIRPEEWANIWVYGMEIVVAGWLTKAEFRKKSRRLPAGSRTLQYPRTQTDNREVFVRHLRPMDELKARILSVGLR